MLQKGAKNLFWSKSSLHTPLLYFAIYDFSLIKKWLNFRHFFWLKYIEGADFICAKLFIPKNANISEGLLFLIFCSTQETSVILKVPADCHSPILKNGINQ